MGGNIGRPVLDLELGGSDRLFVLELSSYQLDLAEKIACRIGVLLNITPDHLDRHGTFDAYVRAKRRLFELQPADGIAIVGVDDPTCSAIADELEAAGRRVIKISAAGPLQNGVFARGTALVDALDGNAREVVDLAGIQSLEGRHNRQNAAAAFAVLRALGVAPADAVKGFAKLRQPAAPHGDGGQGWPGPLRRRQQGHQP